LLSSKAIFKEQLIFIASGQHQYFERIVSPFMSAIMSCLILPTDIFNAIKHQHSLCFRLVAISLIGLAAIDIDANTANKPKKLKGVLS